MGRGGAKQATIETLKAGTGLPVKKVTAVVNAQARKIKG